MIVANMEGIKKNCMEALASRMVGSEGEGEGEGGTLSKEAALHVILDSALGSMGESTVRWTSSPTYHCPCSHKRAEETVRNLPKLELKDILQKEMKPLEITCGFCSSIYKIPLSFVSSII